MHPYVKLWLWGMRALLRIAGPLYLAGVLVLIVYGSFARVPEHDEALGLSGNALSIVVGISEGQRSYVIFPRAFYRPSIITVVDGLERDEVEKYETGAGGLFGYLIAVSTAAFGTWWFWIRPVRRATAHTTQRIARKQSQ